MAGIIGGLILEKGSIQDVAQGTAAMIVLGGTFGAVLVTTPMAHVLRAVRGLGAVFFERASDTAATIDGLIQYATKARKQGIVSLETEAAAIEDPFLRKALSLAVDGTDLQELRKMMEIDIALAEHTAESEAKVWDAAGGYAPTIGIIGAVMGLIQVMKHLEDIKEVGHGIAVAFVATVYGVGSANIFFLPAATKLRTRMHEATLAEGHDSGRRHRDRGGTEPDPDPHEAGCLQPPSGGEEGEGVEDRGRAGSGARRSAEPPEALPPVVRRHR